MTKIGKSTKKQLKKSPKKTLKKTLKKVLKKSSPEVSKKPLKKTVKKSLNSTNKKAPKKVSLKKGPQRVSKKIIKGKKVSTTKSQLTMNSFEVGSIRPLLRMECSNPFELLGPSKGKGSMWLIRSFLPRAQEAWIKTGRNTLTPMKRLHANGFFQATIEDDSKEPRYKIVWQDAQGYREEREDPYAFSSDLSDLDLYLMAEGRHYESYEKLGAHLRTYRRVRGVHFAVWAPRAKAVSVVGNFNHWHGTAHPMKKMGLSGIWGLFVPGLDEGEVYKYAIKGPRGEVLHKVDPYAFRSELRPDTASVVSALDTHEWRDASWMEARKESLYLNEPLSIYELHLGSWRRDGDNNWSFLSYRQLVDTLIPYVKEMGYTHIELMPITEHPLDESWGYQTISYFAPTSRFGTPEDLMFLIDACHQAGIGVLLDWVPAHFPKDQHGLAHYDGSSLYEYDNWKKGEHREWGTLVFDYGRNEVRNFLLSSALFWLEHYHIDGLRVDAVASMIYLDYSRNAGEWEPNIYGGNENLEAISLIKEFNEIVHSRYAGVLTIAEESTAFKGVSSPTYLGGLGFSMKWNMGWMNDSLRFFEKDPVHRKYHHNLLTFSFIYAFSEKFVLPISHDEVVHGKKSLLEKMPGDEWQKYANARLFYGWMFGHPGKKLLFMTNDVGQREEWSCSKSMDWHLLGLSLGEGLNYYLADLLHLYRNLKAFYELDFDSAGFEWIDFSDVDGGVMSFMRWSKDRSQCLVFVFNLTPILRSAYRIGLPRQGFWREILNSDAKEYQGSGIGNFGGMQADLQPWHGQACSMGLNIPPLAMSIFLNEI